MSADLPEWTPQQAIETTWGELIELRYGKSLKNYKGTNGPFPVFGTNGPIGYCDKPLCEYPSVVIGRKGAYRGVHFADTAFFVIDTAYYIEPKFKINLKWAYYYLLTADINGLDSGSAIPSTRREDFYSLPVRIPPLKTQNEIVRVLDSVNKKIQLNTQTNQTLESIAQAIFQSWFVNFEPVKAKMAAKERWYAMQPTSESASPVCYADDAALPDLETYINLAAMCAISGKSETELTQLQQQNPDHYQQLAETAALFPSAMMDSELGEIPEGWEVKALDEIAHYQNGLALQNFRPDGEEHLPVLKIAQLKKGFADGEEKASPNIKPECIVEDGDVIFSWSGSLMIDVWCGGRAALNQHLFKVTSTQYPRWVYYYCTKHHLVDFQRIASDKAVTMGHIKREHLSNAKCALPASDVISLFTQHIESLIEKQVKFRLEIFTLSVLRDSLLPKLLSGEIEVMEVK